MMKKYMLICLLLILSMVWIGCSQANPTPGEPSETEPPVTEPAVTQPIDPNEPEQGMGGTGRASLEYKYDIYKHFYSLSTSFVKLADEEDFRQWRATFDNEDGTTNYDGINLLSFIEEFDIPKEAFVEVNNSYSYPLLTDEQIEALYSKDKKQLADCFINPNAIRVGDEIYPPKWVATHTAEEIAEAGITLEVLTEKCAEWTKTFGELSEIHAQTQAKLAEYKEYVENKQ
ncbi:MAG: hypothetical protein HFE77_06650 [Clostridiales bacterium]|nr:hypothetical protein [Clostridiales bacterium]